MADINKDPSALRRKAVSAGITLLGAVGAAGLMTEATGPITPNSDGSIKPANPTEQTMPDRAVITTTTSPETTTSTTTSTALPEVNVGTGEDGAVIPERDANGNPGPVTPIDGSEVTPDGSFGSIEPVGTTSNGSTPPEGIEAQDQSVPSPTLGGVAPPPAG